MKKLLTIAIIITALSGLLLAVAQPVLAQEKDGIPQECLPKNQETGEAVSNGAYAALFSGVQHGGLLKGVSKACVYCGSCTLCDFLGLANELARIIFGIFGAVAFAMFVWGGISFIISAGSPDKIKSAKGILVNAVIGIFIIAFAWQIVHVVLVVIGAGEGTDRGAAETLFGRPWDNPCARPEGAQGPERPDGSF